MFKDYTNFLGEHRTSETIQVGEHTYPFQFRMPPTSLPASFEGPYGQIKYELTAIAQKPRSEKLVSSIILTVPSTRDVHDEELLVQHTHKAEGKAGRFWFKSGHFDIKASLPKTGYNSGTCLFLT